MNCYFAMLLRIFLAIVFFQFGGSRSHAFVQQMGGHSDLKITQITSFNSFISGYSAKVGFDLTSPSETGFRLRMDVKGFPTGMSIELLGPDGKKVERKEANHPDGFPSSIMEHVKFEKDESVRVSVDLEELFKIGDPGLHKLSFKYYDKKIKTKTILFSKLKNASSVVTEKQYYDTEMRNGQEWFGSYSIKCEASVGQLDEPNDTKWCLALRTRDLDDSNSNAVACHYSTVVDLDSKCDVLKAIVDYRCKLWILLQRDEQYSVLVWDIGSNKVEQKLNWGPLVRLNSTRIASSSRAHIVFARRAGEVTISSLTMVD